jgi:hypothetical protein
MGFRLDSEDWRGCCLPFTTHDNGYLLISQLQYKVLDWSELRSVSNDAQRAAVILLGELGLEGGEEGSFLAQRR